MSKTEESTKPKVTVYSTTWCGFCKMVKAYLESKKVAFTEVNIEDDPEAGAYIVEKTNQMGVPVTLIGETFIIGFDRQRIDLAIAEAKLA
jgi:glutaredoxin-like YruB-family protein